MCIVPVVRGIYKPIAIILTLVYRCTQLQFKTTSKQIVELLPYQQNVCSLTDKFARHWPFHCKKTQGKYSIQRIILLLKWFSLKLSDI